MFPIGVSFLHSIGVSFLHSIIFNNHFLYRLGLHYYKLKFAHKNTFANKLTNFQLVNIIFKIYMVSSVTKVVSYPRKYARPGKISTWSMFKAIMSIILHNKHV